MCVEVIMNEWCSQQPYLWQSLQFKCQDTDPLNPWDSQAGPIYLVSHTNIFYKRCNVERVEIINNPPVLNLETSFINTFASNHLPIILLLDMCSRTHLGTRFDWS